jgi:hypothetical protein
VHSEIEESQVLRVKLGNLLPQQSATIIINYVEPLEVCVNKFWRLRIRLPGSIGGNHQMEIEPDNAPKV